MGDELGLGGLVGECAHRGEGLAKLGQGLVDRGGELGHALALHEGVDAVDELGGRGDELVGGERCTFFATPSIWSRISGTPSAAVPMLAIDGLGLGEDVVEVLDELALGRLVDGLAHRGEDRGDLVGACWMPGFWMRSRASARSSAEVLGGGLDLGRGDDGVDVGEQRDDALHDLLEGQVGDALHQALGGGGDARDAGGGGGQQRVGLARRGPGWRPRHRGPG